MPNPYSYHENNPICPIPDDMTNILYKRDVFLKRIIEDAITCEDLFHLLRFLIWENPNVSSTVLNEVFGLVST